MRHAFSLVELSIVLVILGLLAGGILTGQSLIRAAELRSVTTEFSSYQTAVMTFKDKYFAIPGDMKNASEFWDNSTCGNTTFNSNGCNGNGDGTISVGIEQVRFFKHLLLSDLMTLDIQRDYYGYAAPFQLGVCNPTSKAGGGYLMNSSANGHIIRLQWLGARSASFVGSIVEPLGAWKIDTKLDDGKPNEGNITSAAGNDAIGQCVVAGEYNFSNDDIACHVTFGF